MVEEFEIITNAAADMVSQVIYESIHGGFLTGADIVVRQAGRSLPPTVPPGLSSSPAGDEEPILRLTGLDKAVENLQRRDVLRPHDFYSLEGGAKQQAFTITTDIVNTSTDKFREDVFEILNEQMRANPSWEGFKDAVLDRFDTLPISRPHLEQVFRNNINEAYAQGQEAVLEHPVVEDEFPYRAYHAIRDGRVREEHEALETMGIDGTNIYHKDDPTWQRFRPPWSWNCRCAWNAITIADAARAGVREAQRWLENIEDAQDAGLSLTDPGIEPPHPPVKAPSFSPDPKWERATVEL